MSKALVTGGAGFIGSHLSLALVNAGHEVRVLDDLSTGKAENLTAIRSKVAFLEGDVTDPKVVAEAVKGCDWVFHQAALPSVPRSLADPGLVDRINVFGTVNVLLAAKDAGVKRVVYAASSSAYGDTPTLPKRETMLPAPKSPYAVSKLAGEHYAQAFYACYGLETVSLRYFNVFGPQQDPASEYAAVVPRFIGAILEGSAPRIFGDGLQTRDFCYVDNAVEANLRAATAAAAPGRVFNVACGERVTLLDLVAHISDIVGRQVAPIHEEARAGDVRHSLADIGAARDALGYTAAVKLSEGLTRTIAWFSQTAGSK